MTDPPPPGPGDRLPPDARPINVPPEYLPRAVPKPVHSPDAGSVWFMGGLGIGVAASFVAWCVGWETYVEHVSFRGQVLILPALKLAVALPCMFSTGWRAFGTGLLVSIGVGSLIFLGSCLAHFRMGH
jgi:hypothetical protein